MSIRRAGNPWRILVHQCLPQGGSGDSYNVASDSTFGGGVGEDTSVEVDGHAYHQRHIELPGTEFDELVVGKHGWLHIEQLDTGYWYLHVGGVCLHVKADRDGKPKRVSVSGPGDWLEPVEGCEYTLDWSADSDPAGGAS